MAIITASPNPVGVYSATVGATTVITWDTQLGRDGGKVLVAVNGGAETELPGQAANGAVIGSLPYKVTFPNSYSFVLRRADNQAELARVAVTTYDLRNELIAGFASPAVPAMRPQIITNVVVKPGVDTVRISFNTVRPTIPLTTLMDASGAKIDARFPLFGGLRSSHEAVFGLEVPLAQEAKHMFRIVAAGPTSNPNSPTEAVVDGEFVTGRRTIDIFFDSVDVRNDGDPWPSGSGEFAFRFGAGDAETALPMGEPWPEYGPDDISDDDPPVALGKQLTLAHGPRQLWVQVVGIENDRTAWPWDWGIGLGTRPTFTQPGSKYVGVASVEQASVTSIIDIGSEPGAWTMAFDMATADHPVAYTVSCRLAADLAEGAAIAPKMTKSGGPLKFAGALEDAGTFAFVAPPGAAGRAEAFVLAPDGALHHRTLSPDAARGEGEWTRIPLPGEGAVSLIASAPNAVDLFVRHADGSVSHRGFDPGRRKEQKWRAIGGNFHHVVPAIDAARGKDGGLLLFGVEDDGSLHVRDVRAGGDWDRLGEQPVSAIAPVSVGDSAASLFAVGKDGTLLHFSRQRGRWRSQAVAPAAGRLPTTLLTSALFERPGDKGRGGQDLVLGALSEDHSVRLLRWPDYPRGDPDGRWEELGPLQDLVAGAARPRSRGKAPAKPSSPRRRSPR